jgi:hypothetical protein
MAKPIRVQLDLSEEEIVRVNRIMDHQNVRTRKEVFLSALFVLEWVINESATGRVICSVGEDEKKQKQLVMPILHP